MWKVEPSNMNKYGSTISKKSSNEISIQGQCSAPHQTWTVSGTS